MSSIHFIGGEKGGVGKSLTTRLLAQYFVDRSMSFTGFDSDRSHGTFSRFYTGFTAPVNVEDYTSLDAMIETAEAEPDTEILVDLAAQTREHLNKWVTESDVFGIFQELGRKVYLWHVMDDGADSVFLLDKLLEQHQPNTQLVIVQNQGRGDDFTQFTQSDTYQRALQHKAIFVTLGQLHPALMQKVDFSSLSFWAAANNRDLMSITERRRVGVWLNNCYAQFDTFLQPAAQNNIQLAPLADHIQLA